MPQNPLLFCALAVASLCLYGLVLRQIRQSFPERFRDYFVEFTLLAGGAVAIAVFKGVSPVVIAGLPAAAYALCLITGKGTVATLVYDPRFGDVRTESTKEAQRRLVSLAMVGTVLAVAVALVTG